MELKEQPSSVQSLFNFICTQKTSWKDVHIHIRGLASRQSLGLRDEIRHSLPQESRALHFWECKPGRANEAVSENGGHKGGRKGEKHLLLRPRPRGDVQGAYGTKATKERQVRPDRRLCQTVAETPVTPLFCTAAKKNPDPTALCLPWQSEEERTDHAPVRQVRAVAS